MDTIMQDIRFSVRSLLKTPKLAVLAIVTIALGVGANTAIFSVVDRVLLSDPPYAEPDSLVVLWETNRPRNLERNVVGPSNFLDWKGRASSFEELAGYVGSNVQLTGEGEPAEIPVEYVTPNFFPLLRVSPSIGRAIEDADALPNAPDVAVIDYGLWQRRFGGDPGVVGRRVSLNGHDVEIVGVLPADFRYYVREMAFNDRAAEIWMPFGFTEDMRRPSGRFLSAIGRLAPGVTIDAARAEMRGLAADLERRYPDFDTGWTVTLVPLRDQLVGEVRPVLLVLLGAVAFVLLIACGNVANLLLARSSARRREIAIRSALGAARRRVLRQLLTESLVLALVGGLCGLGLAVWGVEALAALRPETVPAFGGDLLDLRMLGFTLAVTVATGVVFGLVPALETARVDVTSVLRRSDTLSGDARGHRLRSLFVAGQVALALVLLVGAGLLVASLARLRAVDPGYDPDGLLTIRLQLPRARYADAPAQRRFFDDAVGRLRALPGVRGASAIDTLPLAGLGSATGYEVEGRPKPAAGDKLVTDVREVDPDYFRTMGVAMLGGRTFTADETAEARHVVVVNDAFARAAWPNEDPLGKRVKIDMNRSEDFCEVVGVVADVKSRDLTSPAKATAYWPTSELTPSGMTLVVRSDGDGDADADALAAAAREQVREIDPLLAISSVRTMRDVLATSVAKARFATTLLGLFAALALALAGVGIFGVTSYAVSQRRREIGIRMALGAGARAVMGPVVRRGMLPVVAGLVVGLVGAAAVTRLMTGLLFGVEPTDPATFAAVAAGLAAVALAACYLPARRAVRVDPLVSLRDE